MINSALLFLLTVSSSLFTGVSVKADVGLFGNVTTVSFDEGYAPLFADFNIRRENRSASLTLNRYAGSGFISTSYYDYGFFSAKIKLPGNYTAGIVVAFYTSNVDVYEKEHDELDIEFLGDVEGKPWRFQTNVYGNGSTKRGREERYRLWFDPTLDFHRYSILWNPKRIIFYVDEVPIREIVRNQAMGVDYPSKPMSVYATIWDASNWATSGGRYHVRYDYEPFVAVFSDFILLGCPVDVHPNNLTHASADCQASQRPMLESSAFSTVSRAGRAAMTRFRESYTYYSYCYDSLRYPVMPPECVRVPSEQALFKESGRLVQAKRLRQRQRQRRRARKSRTTVISQVVDRARKPQTGVVSRVVDRAQISRPVEVSHVVGRAQAQVVDRARESQPAVVFSSSEVVDRPPPSPLLRPAPPEPGRYYDV